MSSRPHCTYNAGILLSLLIPLLFPACMGGSASEPQSPDARGVRFDDSLTWTAIRAKAKAENKYIFVDCYTTWCGPCKMMNRDIFPQPAVGEYFNKHFISIGVQLDSTEHDDTLIRKRYALGHLLKTRFGIHSFPTFLVFNADGLPLHRLTGARPDPYNFLNAVNESYDTTRQYYTQLNQFFQGRRDSLFLTRLSRVAKGVGDEAIEQMVAKAHQ